MYVHTYIPTYTPTYIPRYVRTYIRIITYIRVYIYIYVYIYSLIKRFRPPRESKSSSIQLDPVILSLDANNVIIVSFYVWKWGTVALNPHVNHHAGLRRPLNLCRMEKINRFPCFIIIVPLRIVILGANPIFRHIHLHLGSFGAFWTWVIPKTTGFNTTIYPLVI